MRTGLKLKHLEISLNNHCSLSCRGCPSLSLEAINVKILDVNKLFEKIQHLEIEEIVFCGNTGEPFEVLNIEEILLKTIKIFPNSKIQISSNGEKLFERFNFPLNEEIKRRVFFQIAVDGPSQEIHEITRRNSDLSKVLNSIDKLIKESADIEVVYSRHQKNENYVKETEKLIRERFGLDVVFRDTTIITSEIRPPSVNSKNGDVSVLYKESSTNLEVTPKLDRMYVSQDGDVYPCVAFVKNKTNLNPPNIYKDQSWIEFYKEFLDFKQSFCNCYRKVGDLRQCVLNCNIYPSFNYDHVEDIS